MLIVQGNISITYEELGQLESALEMKRDVYLGFLRLYGKEDYDTLREANNYADTLVRLKRFKEARSLFLKSIPVARRVLGDNSDVTLKMRWGYADSLYENPAATHNDLREAVTTLEDAMRIARRVLGGAHPVTVEMEKSLRNSRAALRAREAQDAFGAARAKLAKEQSELAQTLADAARQSPGRT